jgi:hypothetical protein
VVNSSRFFYLYFFLHFPSLFSIGLLHGIKKEKTHNCKCPNSLFLPQQNQWWHTLLEMSYHRHFEHIKNTHIEDYHWVVQAPEIWSFCLIENIYYIKIQSCLFPPIFTLYEQNLVENIQIWCFFYEKILNLIFPEKKNGSSVFSGNKIQKSVETPEKAFRPVRSCQTHPIVPKYIQKAQTQA